MEKLYRNGTQRGRFVRPDFAVTVAQFCLQPKDLVRMLAFALLCSRIWTFRADPTRPDDDPAAAADVCIAPSAAAG